MAKKSSVLEVKNLVKKFKKVTAVNNVSFSVREGEIVGLLGPNGAGKTTTIQMLLGVLTPSAGKINYFGLDFEQNREEILGKVNFCSSYIKLPLRMTVWENLDVMARLYEVKDREDRINRLLEVFEMDEYKKRMMGDLSAGQVMRVILAKSFINYPRVLLLDEPTASLDPEIAVKVREFLMKEQKEFGVSMLLTSHNMAEVEQLCDRVIFLNKGKILAEDTPEGLARRVAIARVDLIIEKNDLGKAAKICKENNWKVDMNGRYFVVDVQESEIAKLLVTLGEHGVTYRDIAIDKPDLEDFFVKVAKEAKYAA